jgi:BA14K-like protein
MTKTRTLAATAVLSMIASTQVFANPRDANPAPGTFSQYYPDRDVLNGGAPISESSNTSCAEHYHSYDPNSETFLGHDGRRHSCK